MCPFELCLVILLIIFLSSILYYILCKFSIVETFEKEGNAVDSMEISGDYEASSVEYRLTTMDWKDEKQTHFLRNDPNEEYIDYNRSIKNLCTSFVTTYCLPYPYTFLHLVIKEHEIAFDGFHRQYNVSRPIFCYKGGNLFLFIYRAFIEKFPQMTRESLLEYFGKYFAPSDADFNVMYPPDEYNPFLVKKLTDLCVDVQKKIQKQCIQHLSKYFMYPRYKVGYQKSLLQKLFHDLKKLSIWKDDKNNIYNGKRPIGISFLDACYAENEEQTRICKSMLQQQGQPNMKIRFATDKTQDDLIRIDFQNPRQNLYVQDNRALRFSRGTGILHFDLIRTKFDFRFCLSPDRILHSNGELIDVSLNRNVDQLRESWKNRTNMLTTYTVEYADQENGFNTLTFEGLTYTYLIQDLERVLFDDIEFPWMDEKYEKRIHRLFFVCFLDLFLKNTDNWSNYLVELGNCCLSLSTLDCDSKDCEFIKVKNNIIFSRILQTFVSICRKVRHHSPNHVVSFQEMMQIFIQDSLICLNTYCTLQKYFVEKGKIRLEQIYQDKRN